MINKDFLLSCKNREIPFTDLADITEVKFTGSVRDKLAGFVKTTKNPYCFRVKNTPVKVMFSDKADAPAIETALVNIATRRFG